MSKSFYIVGIQGLEEPQFSIDSITVERKADAIMSPIETGSFVFDNKVIRPLHVTVEASVPEEHWDSVWTKILKMYENRTYNFYEVYSKGEVIGDLMLVTLPRKETSDKYDRIDMTLQFVQVVYAKEGAKKIKTPRKKSDRATRPSGQKTMTSKIPNWLDILTGNWVTKALR